MFDCVNQLISGIPMHPSGSKKMPPFFWSIRKNGQTMETTQLVFDMITSVQPKAKIIFTLGFSTSKCGKTACFRYSNASS